MPGGSIRPGGTGGVITPSGQEILQNKAYEGGTASELDRFVISRDTKANLDTLQASSPQQGALYYATDLKRYYFDDGSSLVEVGAGGATGGINYIDNFDFETTLDGETPSGWVAYADAAGNSPVDGTGGSPNADWTMLGEKTSPAPILGEVSAVLTKTANDRRGHGYAYDFTIDKQFSENPELFKVQFLYNIESGTFDYGDFTDPANDPSELSVWIISDTGGTPVVKELDNFVLDGSGRFVGGFMPDAGITNYRICLHLGTTTAVAWTMAIDNVQVGPASSGQYSRPVVATVSNTTQTNNLTDGQIYYIKYDIIEEDTHSSFTQQGATGISSSSNGTIFTAPVAGYYEIWASIILGNGTWNDGDIGNLFIYVDGTTIGLDQVRPDTSHNNYYTLKTKIVKKLNAGSVVQIAVRLNGTSGDHDISNGSINRFDVTQISGPAQVEEGRVVAASASTCTADTIENSSTKYPEFQSVDFDNHSGFYSGSTGTTIHSNGTWYVCPEAGYYDVSCSLLVGGSTWSVGSYLLSNIKVEGVPALTGRTRAEAAIATAHQVQVNGVVKCNAGDRITCSVWQNSGNSMSLNTSAKECFLSIRKVTGPAAQIGGVTSRAQSWSGEKTFEDEIQAEAGIDASGQTIIADKLQADTITDEAGTGAPICSNGIKVDDAAGQDILNYYQEGEKATNATWNGGGTSGPFTLKYTRVGNVVTIFLTSISAPTNGTSSTQLSCTAAIDSWACPTSDIGFPVYMRAGATEDSTPGFGIITSGGVIRLYRDRSQTTTFPNATCGIDNDYYQHISYIIT